MSVPKGKRDESKMQFLMTARELEIYSIKQASKFPKRYTFYLGQEVADHAKGIYKYAKMGNSIYPTNAHEAQLRRDNFLKSQACAYSLISQIEVCYQVFGLEMKVLQEWSRLTAEYLRLIKGVLSSDRSRYKSLK